MLIDTSSETKPRIAPSSGETGSLQQYTAELPQQNTLTRYYQPTPRATPTHARTQDDHQTKPEQSHTKRAAAPPPPRTSSRASPEPLSEKRDAAAAAAAAANDGVDDVDAADDDDDDDVDGAQPPPRARADRADAPSRSAHFGAAEPEPALVPHRRRFARFEPPVRRAGARALFGVFFRARARVPRRDDARRRRTTDDCVSEEDDV